MTATGTESRRDTNRQTRPSEEENNYFLFRAICRGLYKFS